MTASVAPSILPPLSIEEEEQSQIVARVIRTALESAGGWLSFETFMDLALYAPGLGYYSAGSVKIGRGGDFVTAPELSDLYSGCVARQCAEVLDITGGSILEFGAGTGRMAAAILMKLDAMGTLPVRYAILEVSADLRARQRAGIERLPAHLRNRVLWLDRFPPEPIHGVILANEVLDALPCHRFAVRGGTVRAVGVGVAQDGSFVEREHVADEPLALAGERLLRTLPLPEGYQSELCLRVDPWIVSVARCLERGALLLFDYGLPRAQYYHPQRVSGTLRCHFKQRAHDDPFANVGVQDITAWVDFTRVAEGAVAADLEVHGFVTQAAFLLGCGIESLIEPTQPTQRDAAEAAIARARRASEVRQLLMPGEMGEAFKAMALVKGLDCQLSGFLLQDLRRSL